MGGTRDVVGRDRLIGGVFNLAQVEHAYHITIEQEAQQNLWGIVWGIGLAAEARINIRQLPLLLLRGRFRPIKAAG